jgi:hypothetical protein
MKFIFFPIAIIALQQSTKATAATNWFVSTGGSATIDCPSGAQCCLTEGQKWNKVDTGADAITIFGTPLCYGGTGTTLSGCETEPACVFSCEDACVVEGGNPVAVPSESEAAATTTTEATTAATSSEAMMTTTEATASSSSVTAITYEIPNGGSTTIDCPSGAQCCLTEGQTWIKVDTGAGSIASFGTPLCYGGTGTTLSGCGTEPSCVLACDAGCVVPGGMSTASSTSSEAEAAAAMTTTEATTSTAADSSEATTATTTTGATTTTATTTVASDTTPSPTAKPTSSASAPSMVVAAASTIAAISAFLV